MALHVSRSHAITIRGRPDAVFPMFTPAGEETWVEGWRPEYLHPQGGETTSGMIFKTRHGHEETLWSCTDWEPSRYHVRYLRVTPGSRMGFVYVQCAAAENGDATVATVQYELTSLSAEGDHFLSHLTEEKFRAMIEGWRVDVEAALGRSR